MAHSTQLRIGLAALIALTAVSLVNDAAVAQDNASEGHRLADAWCKSCHVVEPHAPAMSGQAPSFAAIANRQGTTELSLKVFLKTTHGKMPNLIIAPDQADALANYILSLKTN